MKKKKEQQVRRFEPQQDYSGPLLDVRDLRVIYKTDLETVEAIKAATEEASKAFYPIAEKMYQQAGGPQGDPNMGGQAGQAADGQPFYDADYKVVDDDDANK